MFLRASPKTELEKVENLCVALRILKATALFLETFWGLLGVVRVRGPPTFLVAAREAINEY